MPKKILGWLAIVLVGAGSLAAGLQSSSVVPSPASSKRELLDRYCVTCHNEQLRTAGLVLSKPDIDKVSEDRAVWEKV